SMTARRGHCVSGTTASHRHRAPAEQLVAQPAALGLGGFPESAAHHIPCRYRSHQVPAPHFLEPPTQTIAGHPGGLELRYDESHPRMARLIVCPQHLEVPEPPPPSGSLHPFQLHRANQPARTGKLLASRQRPPCLEGTL